ncbi:thiamine pyrophosphate-dependent enzyme [Treponema sp. TIM-1]|uniref:thiamine pyrophosphate-dependent enzyme n=1 Tax=Treponema sp. TIM-1 TaxID=2898417 RepID=UPI00397EB4DB
MEKRRPSLLQVDHKYCPGCGHGIVNRLVAEVLEEMGEEGTALCAVAVGCSSLMPDTWGTDIVQAQHGRAGAVAVGMKRCRPGNIVFAYQGDGDAVAIGLSETLWAAIRNENITVIHINNNNFGMTGGQMSPTTLEKQKTTTTPFGRDTLLTGKPLDIIKMLNTLDVAYLARGTVINNAEILKTKKYIRKAFDKQKARAGYSMVEILSPCPTNWKMLPLDACKRIADVVTAVYPLGEFADSSKGAE